MGKRMLKFFRNHWGSAVLAAYFSSLVIVCAIVGLNLADKAGSVIFYLGSAAFIILGAWAVRKMALRENEYRAWAAENQRAAEQFNSDFRR